MALVIKVYGELAAEVLRIGKDRELCLWLLLRALDIDGNARVKLADVQEAIEQYKLFRWGNAPMSEARLQKWLSRGEGIFWDMDTSPVETKIVYRSLERVCEALGVLPYRKPVAIPIEALATLASARDHLHAAILTADNGSRLTRSTLSRMTGASKRTQRRREKATGVTIERNMSREPWDGERGREMPPGAFLIRDRRGLAWVMSRLANTYFTSLAIMPRGQVRRVRRRLKRGSVEAEPSGILRCYFANGEAAQKCKRKRRPYYIDTGKPWHGFRIWDACQA